MSNVHTEAASHVEVRAVVTRLDGSQHDLGLISAEYKNPFKRLAWHLVHKPLADRRIRKFNASKETT